MRRTHSTTACATAAHPDTTNIRGHMKVFVFPIALVLVLIILLATARSHPTDAPPLSATSIEQRAASSEALSQVNAAHSTTMAAAAAARQFLEQRRLDSPDIVEDTSSATKTVPCGGKRKKKCCGDGKCNGPESLASCPEDCPGVTTDAMCGEEPHSDTGGIAGNAAGPRTLVPALAESPAIASPRENSRLRHQSSHGLGTGVLRQVQGACQEPAAPEKVQ